MTEFVLIRPDELLAMIRQVVREELAASQSTPAPIEPPLHASVGLLDLGPLVGRDWCYATARAVSQRSGFPQPVAKPSGTQPLRWMRAEVLTWLQQREGVLPLARGKANTSVDPHRLMPFEEVLRLTSLARTTLKRRMADGSFPRPCNLGGRRVGWPAGEVHAWLNNRSDIGQSQ